MTVTTTRRAALGLGAAAALSMPALVRAQSSSAKPFAGQTLRLFIYSGAWEKAIATSFIPRFTEMTGAEVIPDPGWWDSIPKLKASPPGQPAFDLVLTDPTQGYPSIKEGLFQKIDMAQVPNRAKMAPSVLDNMVVRDGYGITFPDSVMTLAWNRKVVGFDPTGWGDLLRDDLRGKVMMYNSFYMSLFTFAAIKAAAEGRPGTAHKECNDNIGAVMDYARTNRDRVKYWWPTSTDAGLNLVQQNAGIGNLHSNGTLNLLRQKPEIGATVPPHDRASVQLMWVIPAGTQRKALAEAAMNYLIGEEFQLALARNGNGTSIPEVAAKVAASRPGLGAGVSAYRGRRAEHSILSLRGLPQGLGRAGEGLGPGRDAQDGLMPPARLQISGLTKSYGAHRAVDAVALDVEAGQFFCLLGPSGCGKTTLLRMVGGYAEPDSGQVLIGDQDATRLPPERRDIGMVFQSFALFPHLTALGNAAFGLAERRLPRAEQHARAEAVLDLVGLPRAAWGRRPRQLSGGEQQRVALARALANRAAPAAAGRTAVQPGPPPA